MHLAVRNLKYPDAHFFGLMCAACLFSSLQCSNIVRFKELCKLDPTKHHANGTGGKWALVIEYAKVCPTPCHQSTKASIVLVCAHQSNME
jgi:hypothetical protein